jgi:hypothetical protein
MDHRNATQGLSTTSFYIVKEEDKDPLCLRYTRQMTSLLLKCRYGQLMSVEHAFICSKEEYPSIHHNESRNLTSNLFKEACACIKP